VEIDSAFCAVGLLGSFRGYLSGDGANIWTDALVANTGASQKLTRIALLPDYADEPARQKQAIHDTVRSPFVSRLRRIA
jgi:hypothetical protein